MSQVVLLDTGPLGLATNPRLSPQSVACEELSADGDLSVLDAINNPMQWYYPL